MNPAEVQNRTSVASHSCTANLYAAYMTAVLALSFLLFLAYAWLLGYYRRGWAKLYVPPLPATLPTTFISVIIPARNEANNIGHCLDSILAGDYPPGLYEVIVVNDHSTDDTAAIVNAYPQKNIRLLNLADHLNGGINAYKKKAIEVAITQSKGTFIVCTDADCTVGKHWLSSIAAFRQQTNAQFIAAPVAINCSFRFIEMFQALDFMTLQGITGGALQQQFHRMCNGANLAYTKAAFEKVDGFTGIDHIASGDDMLLMQKIYEQYPAQVQYLKQPSAIVQTAPVADIPAFFRQRIRWASKSTSYNDKSILPVLALVYAFNCALFFLPVIAIFNNPVFKIGAVQFSLLTGWATLLILKTVAELFFLYPVALFFKKQSLLWLFPLMQPFHIGYTIIAGWLGKFGSYEWKGRRTI